MQTMYLSGDVEGTKAVLQARGRVWQEQIWREGMLKGRFCDGICRFVCGGPGCRR